MFSHRDQPLWDPIWNSYLCYADHNRWSVLCGWGKEIVSKLYRHMTAKVKRWCLPKFLGSVIDLPLQEECIICQKFSGHFPPSLLLLLLLSPSSPVVPHQKWHLFISAFVFTAFHFQLTPFSFSPPFSYILIFNYWGSSLLFDIFLSSFFFLFCLRPLSSSDF